MRLSAPVFRLKREARVLARRKKIPLCEALDGIARAQGFRSWSHLASCRRPHGPAARLLEALSPGDMLLLAARPGQGKTVLGLELAAEAAAAGRESVFFSSECSDQDVQQKLSESGFERGRSTGGLTIDLADSVCSGHIVSRMACGRPGTIAVVDYLQVMDQRRSDPPLGEQVKDLKRFAVSRDVTLIFLSQVHRSYDPQVKPIPDFSDLRTSNPVDLALFDKGCFLHDGKVDLLSHQARTA